jgi:hypothetical protein
VRIDPVVYSPPHKRSEPVCASKPDHVGHDDPATQDSRLEDVVQLTPGHDGVWEVKASFQADDDASRFTAAQTFSPVLPRVSRLYHSLLRVYSPAGITRALEPSRGLLVDLYA